MASRHEQAEEREARVREFPVRQVDEMREDMSLQVVDLHHRYVERQGQSLGERDADQQRSEQAGPAREGDAVDLRGRNPRLLNGRIDHRDDVLLVRTRGQFGDYAAVFAVHLLRGDHVRQERGVADDGRRRVVARRFDAQDCNIHAGNLFIGYFLVNLCIRSRAAGGIGSAWAKL